jgi:hypothetical protein
VCTTAHGSDGFHGVNEHLQEGILGHHMVFNILILELGANILELLPHFPLKEEAKFPKVRVLQFFFLILKHPSQCFCSVKF